MQLFVLSIPFHREGSLSDGIESTVFYSSSVVISIIHVDSGLEEGHRGLVPFGQPCANCIHK